MVVDIIPSTSAHVRELSLSLREKDKQEARAAGLIPHKALFYSYKNAFLRRTCLIDGRVAAMFGVVGSPLGIVGQPYLVTGSLVETLSPLVFSRMYIKEVRVMKKYFSLLENYVDADYGEAVRLLKIAGFTLSDVIHTNHGFRFRKFSMKGLV